MDNVVRQIIVVPRLAAVDIDKETVDRHIPIVCQCQWYFSIGSFFVNLDGNPYSFGNPRLNML